MARQAVKSVSPKQTGSIVKRSEIEVRESEEKLRLLIQNAFDMVCILSESGIVLYQSNSIERMLGFDSEEIMGRNIFQTIQVHPDDRRTKEMAFKESVSKPDQNIRSEFRLLHKSGAYYVTVEVIFRNLLNNSTIKGVIANYRDITEKKKLEKQKDQFIGIASHELRTPVTSIKAYAEIMQVHFNEKNDIQSSELIKKLNKQVDRLSDLIKDLLDVTRLTEGGLQLKEEVFDINDLVKENMDEMQRISAKHKISSSLKATKKIRADKQRIGQVLVNLISNAIKYSPEANKIIITTTSNNDNVTISVKDFGIGMTDEVKEKVFDRFYRGSDEKNHKFPGLGLGLYIASEIIKRHGGHFTVNSKIGKGSEFSFILPAET